MTQVLEQYSGYLAQYEEMEASWEANRLPWLVQLRSHAWSRFAALGMPTARRGNERWKYTNVGPIANASFVHPVSLDPDGAVAQELIAQSAPWREDWLNLVFLDGRYSAALSTAQAANGVYVGGLSGIPEDHALVLQQHLGQHASVEDEGFTALNTAFLHHGGFIHVPEGAQAPALINLLFVTTDQQQPRVTYPRVLVVAGRGAELTLAETYVSLGQEPGFTNAVTEIVLEEEAQVRHCRLMLENQQAYHVGTSRVYQGRNSGFTSASFAKGAALGRCDFHALLDGPGAVCDLSGLYLTTGSQHMDNFINIEHAKPHGTSRLLYKGILDGHSRAVFGGTVLVHKDAQHTDAHQTDKNLLLSEDAEVDSKPSLFIYADDVKCGHGATAGHIDAETLFYMRSRGLDLETASRILIQAFAGEIINTVEPEPLREYIDELYSGVVEAPTLALGGA
jgi:Fe-S cluster assembly protein SufD